MVLKGCVEIFQSENWAGHLTQGSNMRKTMKEISPVEVEWIGTMEGESGWENFENVAKGCVIKLIMLQSLKNLSADRV